MGTDRRTAGLFGDQRLVETVSPPWMHHIKPRTSVQCVPASAADSFLERPTVGFPNFLTMKSEGCEDDFPDF